MTLLDILTGVSLLGNGYVMSLQVINFLTYRKTNGANLTRIVFFLQMVALCGVIVCNYYNKETAAAGFLVYLSAGAITFYRQ